MIARLITFLMLVHSLGTLLHASLPVYDGERLSYRVSWAVVPGAGEIKISARKEESAEGPRLVVTTTAATRKLARMLLPFDADSQSVFDLKTGRLLSLHDTTAQRSKRTEHGVTFDYATRQATYVGSKSAEQPQLIAIPTGDPTDMIMGLLQTRSWDLKLGEKRDALVLFANDFYELTIYYTRNEEVRTPLGTFPTMVLEPRMEKTPPKGMYKRGSTVRVWISQDRRRLPVKFEVEFKIGTGTASLETYEGPTAPVATPTPAQDPRP